LVALVLSLAARNWRATWLAWAAFFVVSRCSTVASFVDGIAPIDLDGQQGEPVSPLVDDSLPETRFEVRRDRSPSSSSGVVFEKDDCYGRDLAVEVRKERMVSPERP
jgi:hypothetical protein